MPTGYTAPVVDGSITDLRSFVLRCARAFGPCIEQRDQALDVPPRIDPPSSYYADRLAAATNELQQAEKRSDKQWKLETDAYNSRQQSQWEESMAKTTVEHDRVVNMHRKVLQWDVSGDLVPIKEFMCSQLLEELAYHNLRPRPARMSVAEYKKTRLASLRRDVIYHEERVEKEWRAYEESKAWLAALLNTLPQA